MFMSIMVWYVYKAGGMFMHHSCVLYKFALCSTGFGSPKLAERRYSEGKLKTKLEACQSHMISSSPVI